MHNKICIYAFIYLNDKIEKLAFEAVSTAFISWMRPSKLCDNKQPPSPRHRPCPRSGSRPQSAFNFAPYAWNAFDGMSAGTRAPIIAQHEKCDGKCNRGSHSFATEMNANGECGDVQRWSVECAIQWCPICNADLSAFRHIAGPRPLVPPTRPRTLLSCCLLTDADAGARVENNALRHSVFN